MKKIISIVMALCIAISGIGVFAEDTTETETTENMSVKSIKAGVKNNTMEVGSTQRIVVSVIPSNAENYYLEFYSDNSDVVTAAIGTLIANNPGEANITVKVSGTEISDTFNVTVIDALTDPESPDINDNPDKPEQTEIIKVERIDLRTKTMYIRRYDEDRIVSDIYPENATNTNILYESMNSSIAEVDSNGYVYAKKIGNTKIRVYSEDGGVEEYVKVYVENSYDDDYKSSSSPRYIYITYEGETVDDEINIMETETIQLGIKVSPTSANKSVKWRSSNTKVAKVSDSGKVEATGEGTCKIYATSKSNSSRKDEVTVKITEYKRYPDSISIAPLDEVKFITGNTIHFDATFYPEDTTERVIKWYVNGGATIDQNGNVTIKEGGKITVKAYSQNYKQFSEFSFNAKYRDDHFKLYGETYNIKPNRCIEIYTDADASEYSSMQNIFVTNDESGNGEHIPVKIDVKGKKISISAQDGWSIGDSFIFIKEDFSDSSGNRLGQNIKYKINVRGVINANK